MGKLESWSLVGLEGPIVRKGLDKQEDQKEMERSENPKDKTTALMSSRMRLWDRRRQLGHHGSAPYSSGSIVPQGQDFVMDCLNSSR